jgi:hypothetical protein
MSQYVVYCEDGFRSIAMDDLNDAKEWAHESNQWFVVLDLVTNKVIYTAEQYDFSPYYYKEKTKPKQSVVV